MKKLLALLLAFMLVFSTIGTAFADEEIGTEAGICETLGMLQGDGTGVTAEYLATTPTRLQAAIMFLRLKGLEEDALAWTETDNFADADQVAWAGGKAIMAYLYAHKELGWVGDGGNFNPTGVMTAQAYYKVLLETLGYKQNTADVIGDFTWAGVLDFAAEVGLKEVAEVEEFTVNDLAIATVEALLVPLKGEETTLIASLVDMGVVEEETAVEVGLMPSELDLAIAAAEEAIEALPAEVTLEDAEAVLAAQDLVDAVLALDEEAVIEGSDVLETAIAKIDELEAAEAAKAAAVTAADDAITAIPAEVTIEAKDLVTAARTAVDAALALDANAVITGLDTLVAAEAKIVSLEGIAAAKKAAEDAIAALPATITLTEKAAVTAARTLVTTAQGLQADVVITGLDTLVAAEATITTLETALAVESITATNLREVVVVFNKAVDETEAETEANFAIDGNAPATAVLAEDGKTLTLTMANADALGNYSATSDLVIQSEVGFAADTTIANFAVRDTTVPTMVSAITTGPRTIKVTFSEPLDSSVIAATTVASFTVDNGTVALDTTAATYSGRTITLTTLADLAEGNHSLKLVTANSLVDNATYKVTPATVAFNHVPDNSPITVTVGETTETTIELVFSKAIDQTTIVNNANVYVTHTYKTATNRVTGAAIVDSGDHQTYTVTFTNPLPPGTTTVYLYYADDDGQLIEDNYSNEFAVTNLAVTTNADVTAPTVESVVFEDANTVVVTFSEVVDPTTGLDEANYILKDSSGDAVNITNAAFGDTNKIVELTTATMNGGTYSLKIEDVLDVSVADNELVTVTKTFTATDEVAPTVVDSASGIVNMQVEQIATDMVKVTFSEAMDPAYVTDKDNWQRNSAALDADDTIVMSGTKSVIITFETALDGTAGGGILTNEDITLGRVKDVAGNWIEAFSTALEIEQLATLTPDHIKMTGKKTIQLVFEDQVISGAVAGDFQVDSNGGANYVDAAEVVTGVATSVVDGDTIITLTITSNIANTDGTGVLVRTSGGLATTGAENAYGTALLFAGTAVEDYIAPGLSAVTTDDVDGNGYIDTLVVDFTEGMYQASIQETDFTVEGYTIDSIAYTDADTVTITVEEGEDYDTAATPDVDVVSAVQDAERNTASTLAAITTVDGAAPVMVSVVRTSANNLTYTFSEGVYSANDGTGALAVADITYTPTGAAAGIEALATITHTAGNATFTATTTTDATVGTSTTASAAGAVFDVEGTAAATFADGTLEVTVE